MKWSVACILLGLYPSGGFGAPSAPAVEQGTTVPLDLLEEPDGTVPFERISAADYASKFIRHEERILNIGYSKSTWWIRFQLSNPSPNERTLFIEVPITTDLAELYSRDNNGLVRVQRTGKGVAFVDRDVAIHKLVFEWSLAPGETRWGYLRMSGDDNLTLGATVFSPPAFSCWRG